MKIPIYNHWEMDNLMYPKEEIHWRQIGVGRDYTVFALKSGIVKYKRRGSKQVVIAIDPVQEQAA